MINFITDVRGSHEPDVLAPVAHRALELRGLDGAVLLAVPAPGIWTHSSLVALAKEHAALTEGGADAYLGDCWVGSTEV